MCFFDEAVLNAAPETGKPFTPWVCADQPDALGNVGSFADADWNADEIIDNLYEPLRKTYPEYVTRENIGKDSSGTYDMWKYVFTPETYTQTLFVQSGVHNREKAAVLGLARFLELLCKEEDDQLTWLRNNVRIVVVPIVSPWGMEPVNQGHDKNANGMNLNRDLPNEEKQQETMNVLQVVEEYKNILSCAIDYHSTVNNKYGDYSIRWVDPEEPNVPISNEIVNYLAQKNVAGTPDLHYHGISTAKTTFQWYYWTHMGIPACTVEHGDYRWDPDTKYSAAPITRSVEFIGNVILNYARQEFKLHEPMTR